MNALRTGQRVTVGAVELVVSAVCEPCELMDEIRPGLQEELLGRRGTLCRVVRGGFVRAGDEIIVESVSIAVN